MPLTTNCPANQGPPSPPAQLSNFNWMQAAWMGACRHMTATMLSEYNDSLMLENAAEIEQQLGASNTEFNVTEPNLSGFTSTQELNPACMDFLNVNLSGIISWGVQYYGWPASLLTISLNSIPNAVQDIQALIPSSGSSSFSSVAESYASGMNYPPPPQLFISTMQPNGGVLNGTYTMNQLLQIQAYYANQGSHNNGTANANVMQSLIGQLQAELSQRIQIGQQYVTQETNLATSTDPQSSNQASSEVSAINTSKGQWVQLTGTLSG
ncbi:MAG: hypothetical protein RLZZ453_1195 [Chlamydiota bacterium]